MSSPRSPGDYIREELEKRSWTQEDLAAVLGRSTSRVNQVLLGKQEVSAELAVELETVLGTSAAVWLQREAEYKLSRATVATDDVRRKAQLYALAPVREMVKRGWIVPSEDLSELETTLCKFLGIQDPSQTPSFATAMRKTKPEDSLSYAQLSWCCRAKMMAETLLVAKFSPDRLEQCQNEIRKLASYSQGASKLPQLLASFGIRFVIVEPLSTNKVDGAAFWIKEDSPVIAVSTRYDRIDAFWFTVGHEFSHIKHRDAFSFDCDLAGPGQLSTADKMGAELRADNDASGMFVPHDEIAKFILQVSPLYSKERINQFANRIKIHPGIIVGQLQHRGEIGYSANRETLIKIRQIATSTALTDGWGHTIDPRVFL